MLRVMNIDDGDAMPHPNRLFCKCKYGTGCTDWEWTEHTNSLFTNVDNLSDWEFDWPQASKSTTIPIRTTIESHGRDVWVYSEQKHITKIKIKRQIERQTKFSFLGSKYTTGMTEANACSFVPLMLLQVYVFCSTTLICKITNRSIKKLCVETRDTLKYQCRSNSNKMIYHFVAKSSLSSNGRTSTLQRLRGMAFRWSETNLWIYRFRRIHCNALCETHSCVHSSD